MEAGGSRVRSFVLTFGHAALERFCFSFLCRAGDSKHLSKFRDFISHTLLTFFFLISSMAVTRLFVAPNVANEALLCGSSLYLLAKDCRSEAPGVISSNHTCII